MKLKRAIIAFIAAGSLALSSCATSGSSEPKTVEQRIAACVGMVALGAIAGAIIGNNTGSGNAGQGAVVGAALGGGVCAVWLAFESQRDRQRLAEAQLAAVQSDAPQSASWVGEDGQARSVAVTPSTSTQYNVAVNGAQEERLCRPVETQATYRGRTETFTEVWCRNPADDTWYAEPNATLGATTPA